MSSVRIVQTERLLQNIVRILYSSGKQPMLDEIITQLSRYFSEHPAGRPLRMPLEDMVNGMVSDVNKYNKLLKHIAINVDVLYETSLRQVDDILMLTSSMQTDLERLKKKRRRLETRIDDFMLSQTNTDGYFYSVSDNFSDLDYTNINFTSAEVNTEVGAVMLPTISSTTSRLPNNLVGKPSVSVTVDGERSDYVELSPFSGALEDSLDNIVWAFEVETKETSEVVAEVTIRLGELDPVKISRVDLKPYGATAVQAFMQTREPMPIAESGSAVAQVMPDWTDFGSRIITGTSKMVFGNPARDVNYIKITLRKTEPDYTENKNGSIRYKYILGAKELSFFYQVYVRNAGFVSQPLVIPSEYMSDMVIDAVSLTTDADIPSGCTLRYYIAPSDLSEFEAQHGEENEDGEVEYEYPPEPTVNSYVWHEILPIDSSEQGNKILRFDGALTNTVMITKDPMAGDLELKPTVETGPVQERNPTPSIIPGVNVYRIADVEATPLGNSVSLLEGVNTTRIYSKNIDNTVPFMGGSTDPTEDTRITYRWSARYKTEPPEDMDWLERISYGIGEHDHVVYKWSYSDTEPPEFEAEYYHQHQLVVDGMPTPVNLNEHVMVIDGPPEYTGESREAEYHRGVDIPYWSDIIDHYEEELTVDYGRIDAGNGFFYGGDVGAVGKDVYVETYLYADQDWSTFLSEFQKSDPRSRTWAVKVFLNGKPIGSLPPGTDKMQLPWSFRQGLNHVLLLIRIPMTAGVSDPYMGVVRLFESGNLFNYGSVHLSKWEHVDLFTMKYNESGSPKTFTIHDNTIISRRKPTTNFQLRYSQDTGNGPVAVLFRADLTRSRNNPTVTPELDSYRIRFSYAED